MNTTPPAGQHRVPLSGQPPTTSQQPRSAGAPTVRTDGLDRLPPFLSVVEAGRILGLSRTTAYKLAHLFEVSDGAEGLPVIRLGRTFRVPRAAIIELASTGVHRPLGQ